MPHRSMPMLALGLLLIATSARAQTPDTLPADRLDLAVARQDSTTYYFHQPELGYGSASLRSPLETALNRGMSNVVLLRHERQLSAIDWSGGWSSVVHAMRHPRAAIDRSGGPWEWFKKEFIIEDGKIWHWAWAPNYGGHLLAGGITYRFMAEWYEAQGVPRPRMAAGVSHMAIMLLNEVVENPGGPPGSSTTVTDLYILDPLAMLIFSFDAPARFFSETLQAADWSPQASITMPDGQLINSSQLMSYKVPLPVLDRTSVLLIIGLGAGSGLHQEFADGYGLGAIMGFDTQRRFVDPETGAESIEARYGGALFFDRHNSLLVSAHYSRRDHGRIRVNVFPGILPGKLNPIGLWAEQTRDRKWSAGIALRQTLGVGTGWDF